MIRALASVIRALTLAWYRWRLSRVVGRMVRVESELLQISDRIRALSDDTRERCACGQLDSPNHRATCWQARR